MATVARVSEQALKPLAAYRAPNWSFLDDGYYIHRNRVYLQGSANNFDVIDGTLFTGVPDDMRPPATQTAPVVLIAPDPATPGIAAPTSTTMTITPDGTISIPVPPYANEAPDGAFTSLGSDLGWQWTGSIPPGGGSGDVLPRPMFPDSFSYTVVLGNVSWSIGESHGAYDSVSLGPYLASSDFENVDAMIAVHDARVHLGGRIRAKHTGARRICNSLPSDYTHAIDSDNGDYTTAKAPRMEVAMTLSPGGMLDVANQDGHLPRDADAPPLTSLAPANVAGIGSNQPPVFGSADSAVAGLTTHPTRKLNFSNGEAIPPSSWSGPEPGGERVQAQFVNAYGVSGLDDGLTVDRPGIFVEVASMLAQYYPPPDWCAMQFAVGTDNPGFKLDTDPKKTWSQPTGFVVSADAPCLWVQAFTDPAQPSLPPLGAVVADFPIAHDFANTTDGIGVDPVGWLAPPSYPSSTYTLDPNNPAAAMLWRPEEIPTAFTYLLQGGENYLALAGMGVFVIPFWYTRRQWIVKDDVIDLTGCGWQSPYTAPAPEPPELIPGSIASGPGASGQVGWIAAHGQSGKASAPAAPPTGGNWSVQALVQLALSVGVSGENAAVAAAIAMAESGGNPGNVGHNPGPPESWDRGLWQINNYYHPDVSDECAFDPQCNAHAMYSISNGGTDWSPWSTYNSGAYLQFIDQARAALANLG